MNTNSTTGESPVTNPNPKWKQDACKWCAKGVPQCHAGGMADKYFHAVPHRTVISTPCAAPPEAQHIERLTARVVDLERDRWTCFHCGFSTADPKEASAHFGDNDEGTALCQDWAEMNTDERAGAFQGAVQELNGEREENAKLRTANEGLEYQVNGFAIDIGQYFKGCQTPYEAFCKFDSMEGRALAAEERLNTLRAGIARLKAALINIRDNSDSEPCDSPTDCWCPWALADRAIATQLAPEATDGR